MSIQRVKCDSGLMGWRSRLQESYEGGFEQFERYSDIYGLAHRLGFESAEEAWQANPMVQGSTIPSDFRVVTDEELNKAKS